MTWKLPITGPWRVTADYTQIIIGSFLVGIGVNLFFIPNQVVSGGVTGIAIFAVAAFQFGAEAVMVALALAFVSSRVLDTVQAGFSASRQTMIITNDPDGVRDAIFANLHRGVTLLEARGGFTGRSRPMLYVVVGAHEVGRLKLRVAEVDPDAFVAISKAQEVFGEGFTPAEPESA